MLITLESAIQGDQSYFCLKKNVLKADLKRANPQRWSFLLYNVQNKKIYYYKENQKTNYNEKHAHTHTKGVICGCANEEKEASQIQISLIILN